MTQATIVTVESQSGETVGPLCDDNFRQWQRLQEKTHRSRIGVMVGETQLIDTLETLRLLPSGQHSGLLVKKVSRPKKELRKYEAWKVI